MRKILAFLMSAVMLLSVSGCGGTQAGSTTKDTIKVGVIYIGDPADGSGYSYTHDLGIREMQESLGLNDNQIIRKINIPDDDSAATKTAIEDCIAEGCSIVFGTSYGYMDTMESLAAEYPDIYFSHSTGYKSNQTNFNNYFGRIYQARYLAGIAAGLKTTADRIGYVSAYGTELAETCSGINAFALGVQAVNPDAVVYVKTLSSWFDPANETAYAEALIEMGCDVIAQHCDTANPQIAAQNASVFGCGYNSDMTAEAPAAHLVAPVWNWGVYYTAAVQAVIDDKWTELGNYYAGIEADFVDVSPVSENCAENTEEYIRAVKNLIRTGEWDVFSGVALSFDADGKIIKTESPLKTNDGKTVDTVDDGAIKGSMNYFVAGVELV